MKQNPIDIVLPKGDAKTSIEAAYDVQTQGGEILVPELPDVGTVLEQRIRESIETNIQSHPESVQAALMQGMTTLTQIEARIKADSGNVNHQGIGLDNILYTYMSFVKDEVEMVTVVEAMAESIKTVIQTQSLMETEAYQLTSVLKEIVGDVKLAEMHIVANRDVNWNLTKDGNEKTGVLEYEKGDVIAKEHLEYKPKNSRKPDRWLEKGGRIVIDEKGTWTYIDWEGHIVEYPNGYPDFKKAGMVIQEVEIEEYISYSVDFSKADSLAQNGPKHDSST